MYINIGRYCLNKFNIVRLNIVIYNNKYLLTLTYGKLFSHNDDVINVIEYDFFYNKNDNNLLNDINNIINDNKNCNMDRETINFINRLKLNRE
jgi:hypothetical protein